jgi:hypothetical protein
LGLAVTLAASPAAGLDYDRNDVRGREVSIGAMASPIEGEATAFFVRGTARRHTRSLYFGLEALAGVHVDGRPLLETAGAVGLESAADGWTPVRAYGEAGVGLLYAHTNLADALNFHVEGGLRYQVAAHERPHVLLHIGLRLQTSFSHLGGAVISGVAWTFD